MKLREPCFDKYSESISVLFDLIMKRVVTSEQNSALTIKSSIVWKNHQICDQKNRFDQRRIKDAALKKINENKHIHLSLVYLTKYFFLFHTHYISISAISSIFYDGGLHFKYGSPVVKKLHEQ